MIWLIGNLHQRPETTLQDILTLHVFTCFLYLGCLDVFPVLLTHSTQVKFDLFFFAVEVHSSSAHRGFED